MNAKLNWTELRHEISKKSGVPEKEVNAFLVSLVAQIKIGLSAEGMVRINGLGTFTRKAMSPRKSVDVSTGEAIVIPGYNKITFTASMAKSKVEQANPIEKIGEQANEIMDLIAGLTEKTDEPVVAEPEKAVEPVVAPEPEKKKEQKTEKTEKKEKKHKGIDRPWLAASLTVLCFALTLAGVYLYIGYRFRLWVEDMNEVTKPKTEMVLPELSERKGKKLNLPPRADSTQTAPAVQPAEVKPETKAETKAEAKPEVQQVPTRMPNLSETLTTEVMDNGSRLRWIAQKHYGNPELWVYIYEANKKKIKNPNQIRIGTELRIPKLSQEWLELTDPQIRLSVDSLLDLYEKR